MSKKIPAGLVVLFAAIALSSALNLSQYGVEVVGTLPQGLPALAIPKVPIQDLLAMVLPAIGVLLVAFSEGLGVAHEFADKHGYEVDAEPGVERERVGQRGQRAVRRHDRRRRHVVVGGEGGAGARTQMASLVTWIVTIVTVLFLTPLFASLPEAVLGALIIHAVWHIIASRKLVRLRQEAPAEVWFGVLAMAGVLLIDVLQGMIIGVVASLVFVVYRTAGRMSPRWASPGDDGRLLGPQPASREQPSRRVF